MVDEQHRELVTLRAEAERSEKLITSLEADRAQLDAELHAWGHEVEALTERVKELERDTAELRHLRAKHATLQSAHEALGARLGKAIARCWREVERTASMESRVQRELALAILLDLEPELPGARPPAAPLTEAGEGWRLLRLGEVIESGDEYLCATGTAWRPTGRVGDPHGYDGRHRRRRIVVARVPDFEMGEGEPRAVRPAPVGDGIPLGPKKLKPPCLTPFAPRDMVIDRTEGRPVQGVATSGYLVTANATESKR